MSGTARAAFALVPLTLLAGVVWIAATLTLPVAIRFDWIPSLDIALAFRIDGLSLLMLLLITGVGSAVFVYAGGYLAGHRHQRRLFVLLTFFMFAMIGCVTADHLFVLFLFWELTSLLSFLLVGFEHDRPASRRSAQQAMLVTGTGGLALLAGFILLAGEMGTASLSTLIQELPGREQTPALTAALLLVLVGAFTKSAQFPFHYL